jgi:hypothetical protein
MNDPHVVTLYYNVKHLGHVHYDKSGPARTRSAGI